jgi:hypothetical protein
MTGKRKASDDAPGTSRPPTPRREAESDEECVSPSAYLASGGWFPIDLFLFSMFSVSWTLVC